MSRFITTKADFTLRRKHKKGSGATVYEHDYTTITPMPNAFKKEYVIGDSNFKFTTRLGVNGQKKHTRGKYVPNPSGSTEENGAWTLDTIINSAITNESRIRLRPNYSSIRDFACYGSANKLVQGTINGVIMDFPAEMWLSTSDSITIYNSNNGVGYSFNELTDEGAEKTGKTERLLFNEYGIDITTENIQETSVYNPLRYLCLCGSSYTLITVDDSGNTTGEYPFSGFDVKSTALGECYDGKNVEVDKVFIVYFDFSGVKFCVNVYRDYTDNMVYYTYNEGEDCDFPEEETEEIITIYGDFEQQPSAYSSRRSKAKKPILFGAEEPTVSIVGAHIRPKKEIIEEYFRTCDDFTAVLLDRRVKPIYTATFETPKQTEAGYVYDMVSYTWPSLLGGYNPDLSAGYYAYVESLISLADYYDEFHCDNMWRSLTHEAIKALDWTYISNSDGDIQDMSTIDTSRVEPITKIYGRQFDDLKRYADGIKRTNTITYNQKSNAPDYVLTDILENSGWETKTLKITTNKEICTPSLYPGLSTGYTASDASTEFLRRLKLNSQYLFSIKGTRKGLDSMLAMFGFTPEEYDIHEYVYVAKPGGDYDHFCGRTTGKSFPYPLAEDVEIINKYKVNFNINDPYGEYCGIPVAPIGFWRGGEDYSYVVPWYSYGKNYDDGLYFQMNGGWGNRKDKLVNLEIAPEISAITENGPIKIYDETQARLKFANDFDEMMQQAMAGSVLYDVFYVTDISKITEEYTFGVGETSAMDSLSHYFVLEDEELVSVLGKSGSKYGWRNIKNNEITADSTSAGTLVLYLESIIDDTTGNNPHTGGGTYDDGASYIESITDIFGYSLINKNFIGINDATCDKIKKYVFDKEKQEDNRKCWYFTDNYNTTYDKSCSAITFKSAVVTDEFCSGTDGEPDGSKIICGEDAPKREGKTITDVLTFLESELATENQIPSIGAEAEPDMEGSSSTLYHRGSQLVPFNPENTGSTSGEGAANSIINVKNMVINFNLTAMNPPSEPNSEKDGKEEMKEYINEMVIPYLTQMIPSTTILSWTFDGK